MAIEPETVRRWRFVYGATALDLATRDVYHINDETSGEHWHAYLVSIRAFEHPYRVTIERAYAAMSGSMRATFYALGAHYSAGMVVPIPTEGTMVWRVEDEQGEAWEGERRRRGPISGTTDHRWGAVG